MINSTTIKITLSILTLAAISIVFCLIILKTSAYASSKACSKVEIIYARGSGDGDPLDEVGEKYIREIKKRLENSDVGISSYYLGTESQGGYKYPHVDVLSSPEILYDTAVSAGTGGEYGRSVHQGVLELFKYINQRYNQCKESGTLYILGGYSQGAHVVGDGLEMLKKEIRDRIVFVGLFGDPKLYYPEGKGDNPPACQGKGWSPYRRVLLLNKCHHWQGTLKAREPYVRNDMMDKIGLWCYDRDLICGTSNIFWVNEGHGEYLNKNRAVDQAALEAVSRIKQALDNEPKPHPETPKEPATPSPPPPPPINYDELIDTSFHFGHGTSGQEFVFLIDIGSPTLRQLVPQISDYIAGVFLQFPDGAGVGTIMYYADLYAIRGDGESSDRLGSPDEFDYMRTHVFNIATGSVPSGTSKEDLSNNIARLIITAYDALEDKPGNPYGGIQYALDNKYWYEGATKSIILITDQPHDGSPDYLGNTADTNAKRALEIDPVNIFPVIADGIDKAVYIELANKTSGQVSTFHDKQDFVSAGNTAYENTIHRPVPFLKLAEYISDPGQEITFDASDSYVIDSTITKYEWDFDGDNIFEATTTSPVINHTYNELFDGHMQVRVTAASGGIANMSAKVKIGTYVPPVLPKTPTGLQITILETENDISTIRLTWDPIDDGQTTSIALRVNGVMLGIMTPDRTSIDITDVDRTFENDFSINGVDATMAFGNPAVVTLDGPGFNFLELEEEVTPAANTVDKNDNVSKATPDTKEASSVLLASTSDDAAVLGMESLESDTAIQPKSNLAAALPLHTSNSTSLPGLPWYGVVLTAILAVSVSWKLFSRFRSRR